MLPQLLYQRKRETEKERHRERERERREREAAGREGGTGKAVFCSCRL